jgi:hypothetical protein
VKNKMKGRSPAGSYGINSKYIDTLKTNGHKLTALSADGQARAFEIKWKNTKFRI